MHNTYTCKQDIEQLILTKYTIIVIYIYLKCCSFNSMSIFLNALIVLVQCLCLIVYIIVLDGEPIWFICTIVKGTLSI